MKKTFRPIFVINVIGEMLFIFGLLGWFYGVATQITQPAWLPTPVSHLFPWLRLDTFTVLSFLASALGFFVWRLSSKLLQCPHDNQNN
ncbi:MAG: hypothetical protein ABSF44_08530 [Candidatus Bathyarchaeia archaeon]|jgi:hypothetical protein